MIQQHEAQKLLIQAGFAVDMQSPYRQLTILDAKYEDVKNFLIENGYVGDIVVIREIKRRSTPERTEKAEGKEEYPDEIKIVSGASDKCTDCNGEEIYEQMELRYEDI